MRLIIVIAGLFISLLGISQDLGKQKQGLTRDVLALDVKTYVLDTNHNLILDNSNISQTYHGKDYVYTSSEGVTMLSVEDWNVIVDEEGKTVIVSYSEDINLVDAKKRVFSIVDTIIGAILVQGEIYSYDGIVNGMKQYSLDDQEGTFVLLAFNAITGDLTKISCHEKGEGNIGGVEIQYEQLTPIRGEVTKLRHYITNSKKGVLLTENFKGYELITTSN